MGTVPAWAAPNGRRHPPAPDAPLPLQLGGVDTGFVVQGCRMGDTVAALRTCQPPTETEQPPTDAQDVNVMVCEADAAAAQAVALGRGRQAYLLAIEGSLQVQRRASGGSSAAVLDTAVSGGGPPAAGQGAQRGPEAERDSSRAGAPAEALAALVARDAAELVAPRDADLPLLLVPGAQGAHFMLVEMARP